MRVLGFGTYDVARPSAGRNPAGRLRGCGDEIIGPTCRSGSTPPSASPWSAGPGWHTGWCCAWPMLVAADLACARVAARRGDRCHRGRLSPVSSTCCWPGAGSRAAWSCSTCWSSGPTTADDRGLGRADGVRRRLLGRLDRVAAAAADIIVVDTMENRSLLAVRQRPKAVVGRGRRSDVLAAGRADRAQHRAALRPATRSVWCSSDCSRRCREST